jgi:O-antigen/teichoic acid export membrane protein
MPWTLTYCVWYSLLLVAQNYVWCAERAKLAVIPLAAGLCINVAIDLALIPTWGLLGAVVATTVATAVALAMLYWVNHRAGMRLERGMILLSIAPAALCGGVWCGTAAVLLVGVMLPFSKTLITPNERVLLAELVRGCLACVKSYWSRSADVGETSHAV